MDHLVARALLGVLRLVYRTKDRELGRLIRQTAGLYDTRPQVGHLAPEPLTMRLDELRANPKKAYAATASGRDVVVVDEDGTRRMRLAARFDGAADE